MSQEGNRLKRIFTDEEYIDIKAAIKSIFTKLSPVTVYISDEEVPSLLKVGDGDKVLISDCLSEDAEATHLLPPYFQMSDIKTSDTLHDQLYVYEDAVFELYQHIRRNRMLAGSEASSGVSTFYAYIKAAATGKNIRSEAVAMFSRLQSYYLKRSVASKAKKRQIAADKAATEAEKVAAEAIRAAEKAAVEAAKATS